MGGRAADSAKPFPNDRRPICSADGVNQHVAINNHVVTIFFIWIVVWLGRHSLTSALNVQEKSQRVLMIETGSNVGSHDLGLLCSSRNIRYFLAQNSRRFALYLTVVMAIPRAHFAL